MVSVKFLISTTAAVMVSTAAFAADMPQPLPPQPYQPQLMVMAQPEGAWYLRGDIGVGIMSQASVEYLQNPLNSSNFSITHSSMGDTTFFMGGIGYEWNNWLRFDVTGEYRSKFRSISSVPTRRPPARHRFVSRFPAVRGLPRQCLCRSRHLGLPHAIRRRRRRRSLEQICRPDRHRRSHDGKRLRPRQQQCKLRLGIACRPCLQSDHRISRSSLPTATSITARSPMPINCTAGCNPDSYKFSKI